MFWQTLHRTTALCCLATHLGGADGQDVGGRGGPVGQGLLGGARGVSAAVGAGVACSAELRTGRLIHRRELRAIILLKR